MTTFDVAETDDKPTSKAEFVWLMIELQRLDPEMYEELRDRAWEQIALLRDLFCKSVFPN